MHVASDWDGLVMLDDADVGDDDDNCWASVSVAFTYLMQNAAVRNIFYSGHH